MKKLILSSLFVFGTITAIQAQEEKPLTAMNETSVEANTDQLQVEAAVQDYKEIKSTELPQPVKSAVAADFRGATISKAYANGSDKFKLVLVTADSENMKKASKTVFINSKGEWIKDE